MREDERLDHEAYEQVEETAEASPMKEWEPHSTPRHDQAAVMTTVSSCGKAGMELLRESSVW